MAMGNNILAFLAGAGSGYMKQAALEEENAWKKEQRDAWRQERDDKKAERSMIQNASQPIEMHQWSGGEQAIESLNDKFMGPREDTTPQPMDFNAPMAYRVGGQTFSDQALAQKELTKQNSPESQAARMAQGYRSLGNAEKAIAIEHSSRQAQLANLQLADAQFRNDLGEATNLGFQGLVDFANSRGGDRLGGRKIKAVTSEDGKTVTLVSVGPDGAEQPMSEPLPNNELGVGKVAWTLDRLVTPQQRMDHFTQRQDKEQQQQNWVAAHNLSKDQFDHQKTVAAKNYQLNAGAQERLNKESDLRLKAGQLAYEKALEENKVPPADKMLIDRYGKELDEINKAIVKAQAEGTWNLESPSVKMLLDSRTDIRRKYEDALAPYTKNGTGARGQDPFGFNGGAAPDFGRMVDITIQTESGGRRYGPDGKTLLTSPKGAQGEMQVMPGTNLDPGFGVRPAKDSSPDERARVGRDYLQAMMGRYDNDPAKAWAAYNWGPGALDAAIKKHGDKWLANAPKETQDYVRKNMAALGADGGTKVAQAGGKKPDGQRGVRGSGGNVAARSGSIGGQDVTAASVDRMAPPRVAALTGSISQAVRNLWPNADPAIAAKINAGLESVLTPEEAQKLAQLNGGR